MVTAQQILADLANDKSVGRLPERLCVACNDQLAMTGVGLALMTDQGHEGIVGVSNDGARVLEELQFTLGEGPCLDASGNGRPSLQPDLARSAQRLWPAFGPAVLEAGIAAVFAFPLQLGGIRVGVLDVYRDRPGSLDREQMGDALAYADAALVLLLHLQHEIDPGEGLHPELIDPLDYRPEVHQATGMIAVQAAVGLTEALLLLRARAFSAERSLLGLARDVLARRLRFDLKQDADEE